jgi:hypothetical protein
LQIVSKEVNKKFNYNILFSLIDLHGGVAIVEMLNRCNILALIGGGKNPRFAPNKLILWDDNQEKMISELRFTSYIKNVKMKKEK